MKTRDEFAAAFADELRGLILASFARDQDHTYAKDGQFIVTQMRRASDLLVRMYAFLQDPPKPLESRPNGAVGQTRQGVGK